MVGLPYPDKRDPELKQKMAYLDKADPARYCTMYNTLDNVFSKNLIC